MDMDFWDGVEAKGGVLLVQLTSQWVWPSSVGARRGIERTTRGSPKVCRPRNKVIVFRLNRFLPIHLLRLRRQIWDGKSPPSAFFSPSLIKIFPSRVYTGTYTKDFDLDQLLHIKKRRVSCGEAIMARG